METTRPSLPQRISLSTDSKVEGFVKEADQCVNSVALSAYPSAGFRDKASQHSRAASSSPSASSNVSPPISRKLLNEQQQQQQHQQLQQQQQQQQPPPTPTLPHSSNESNAQATTTQPVRRRKGQPPDTPVSSSSEYPYVPPYQQQQPSQGVIHISSSLSLPSTTQQPGVNESGCAVHRHNTSASRPAPSPVNTRLTPSSSKSKGCHSQDPPPSSGGRRPIGDESSMAGTSHPTSTNRINNGLSQPPENSRGGQIYNDPPPSFDDALRAHAHTYIPVVGSRSEVSLANTPGRIPVRSATGKVFFFSLRCYYFFLFSFIC